MKPITLPKWLSTGLKKVTTKSGGSMTADHVVLLFALSLRIHDCADKLRGLAGRLESKVPMEIQPKLKAIRREPDDYKVFGAVMKIINLSTDQMGILKGQRIKRNAEIADEAPAADGATARLLELHSIGIVESPIDHNCQVDKADETKDGWGWPFAASTTKAHFFIHGKALCGKWKHAENLVYASNRERCATCKRMLLKVTGA